MHAKMDARLISNHEYDAMRTEIDRLRADLSVARHRIRELEGARDHWREMAVRALHDLRVLGVPIERIIGITPDVLAAVEDYGREQTAYT